jgi:NAD+ kinase
MTIDETIKALALRVVNQITTRVRREQRQHFAQFSRQVGIGADGTPTTYIDKVAEDVAIRLMKRSKTPVNLCSEEAGVIDFSGDYTFVLDPVDGTRNAYRGIPFYAVSLAVGRSRISDCEFGIVRNIPTGDVFIAEKGKGAFLNGLPIRTCDVPAKDMMSSIVLGRSATKDTLVFASRQNHRSLGAASLEMCLVASGALDFYLVGSERMRVIDIAASTLIVREAGGLVKTMDGRDLDMEFSLAERSSVVAACSEALVGDLLGERHK